MATANPHSSSSVSSDGTCKRTFLRSSNSCNQNDLRCFNILPSMKIQEQQHNLGEHSILVAIRDCYLFALDQCWYDYGALFSCLGDVATVVAWVLRLQMNLILLSIGSAQCGVGDSTLNKQAVLMIPHLLLLSPYRFVCTILVLEEYLAWHLWLAQLCCYGWIVAQLWAQVWCPSFALVRYVAGTYGL
ncbi:hypothetical protein U1Q18_001884 [Sarracenia purpurea var. burkii]